MNKCFKYECKRNIKYVARTIFGTKYFCAIHKKKFENNVGVGTMELIKKEN